MCISRGDSPPSTVRFSAMWSGKKAPTMAPVSPLWPASATSVDSWTTTVTTRPRVGVTLQPPWPSISVQAEVFDEAVDPLTKVNDRAVVVEHGREVVLAEGVVRGVRVD